MDPASTDRHTLTTARSSGVQLSLFDLLPAAIGAAGVFSGPLVANTSLIGVLASCAGAFTFLGGSLVVLRRFGRSLVPAVLTSAGAGAIAAAIYWVLARPDLTAVGTAGLGAIGGAVIAPFELIWVQFRYDMAQLEANSDFEYTGFFSTLWRMLRDVHRIRRERNRQRIGRS
jgi:hypothetical protein